MYYSALFNQTLFLSYFSSWTFPCVSKLPKTFLAAIFLMRTQKIAFRSPTTQLHQKGARNSFKIETVISSSCIQIEQRQPSFNTKILIRETRVHMSCHCFRTRPRLWFPIKILSLCFFTASCSTSAFVVGGLTTSQQDKFAVSIV